MEKKRMGKKAEKRWEREDEVLDLKELMDVQGGIEPDDENKGRTCLSLGCYSLEIPPIEDNLEKGHEE